MLLFPSFCSRFYSNTTAFISPFGTFRLPGVSGLQYQRLRTFRSHPPIVQKEAEKQRAKETVLLHKTPRPLRHMPDDLTAGFPHSDLSSFIRPQTLQVFLTGNLLFLHKQNDFILIGIRNMTKIIFHHINVSS